jgi:glycine/D-amino acid oxidase-like deaminating enzyme
MIAPAVARILADALLGEPADEALGILDVARFEESRPMPEPQLV